MAEGVTLGVREGKEEAKEFFCIIGCRHRSVLVRAVNGYPGARVPVE